MTDPAKLKRVRIAVAAAAGAAVAVWGVTRLAGREFLYAGTVEVTEVDVSARVASVIRQVKVAEGEPVREGQELIALAGEDVRLAADLAEKNYRRAVELNRGGSLSDAEFDRAKYQREEAALKRRWCSVTAPMGGVVLSVYREAGELVGPGTRLLTLGNTAEAWVYIYVPQPVLARIGPGLAVEGSLPEVKGRRFPGRIAHIRDEAEFTPRNVQTREERTRLVYGVKVVFPNPDGILKPGMTIEVLIPEKQPPEKRVPAE